MLRLAHKLIFLSVVILGVLILAPRVKARYCECQSNFDCGSGCIAPVRAEHANKNHVPPLLALLPPALLVVALAQVQRVAPTAVG